MWTTWCCTCVYSVKSSVRVGVIGIKSLGLNMAGNDWNVNHQNALQSYQDYVLDRGGDIQSCIQLKRSISLEQNHILLIKLTACGRCLSCEAMN